MANQNAGFTHFAILIGINAYPDQPLKYCVQDVESIKTYLEKPSKLIHIQLLTASVSVKPESFNTCEDPVLLPTYENVIAAFEKVSSLAKDRDFVYIHYSGHGTREKPDLDDELSNKNTGDLALVLLNGRKGDPLKYLWGQDLAGLIKSMVERRLVVTLALDCCFSATVYRRDDPSIRFLPYDTKIGSKFPLNGMDPGTSLQYGVGSSATRDASMLPNWLINPDAYAIITACGPHENAKEFETEDGQAHGALTYFLLSVLKKCGGLEKRHKIIHDHLRAEFRKSWPQQNPVLYGNKDQGFFGHTDSNISVATVLVIEKQNRKLELQAGQAHGVCDGDQFLVYLLPNSGSHAETMVAKVDRAGALTSDLELLDMASHRVQIDGTAKALTRSSLRKFSIQLATDLPYRDELLIALKERSLNVHDDNSLLHSFQIAFNNCEEYEVLDKNRQKIISLPIMIQNQTVISSVCDVMEHLTKFDLVKELVNVEPADPFRQSFSAIIINRSGQIYHPGGLIEVELDNKASFMFELQIENKFNKDIYVFVYFLGSCWQVCNILRGSHEVIPPQNNSLRFTGIFKKKLKTTVPSNIRKEDRHFEDIIKVFVTSQPTSFDLLELPKLGDPVKKNTTSRTNRGGDNNSPEDWAALSFRVRTYFSQPV